MRIRWFIEFGGFLPDWLLVSIPQGTGVQKKQTWMSDAQKPLTNPSSWLILADYSWIILAAVTHMVAIERM